MSVPPEAPAWLTALIERQADAPAAFAERLRSLLPDFWTDYRFLYPDLDDPDVRVVRLVEGLVGAAEARDPALQALDAERDERPFWFQEPRMVGMTAYVDLFAETLDGVAERIPYLQELGVTYLYLMPLLHPRPGENDGGYAVQDYRTVDPRLGTMDQLRSLAARLHEAGIALAIDFVMNHTAREHAWAQAALAGDPHYQGYYYLYDDRTIPDAFEAHLIEIFPDFAPGSFTHVPELDKWVWTTFYDFQWDLNYANPDVFEQVLAELLFLANVGVDVFRLDAVPFLWKRLGTTSQNQPEVHALLRAFRTLMRIVAPGVLFKAEAIVAPEEIIRYLGHGGYEGRACDLAYNAFLMSHFWEALATERTHLLRQTTIGLPETPEPAGWITYVRSHDDVGWIVSDEQAAAVGMDGHAVRQFCTAFYVGDLPGSYAEGYRFQVNPVTGEARVSATGAAMAGLQKARIEGDAADVDLALRRLLLLHGVCFFMKGIPVLYSGDELGQLNNFDYLDDPLRARDNRWVHRSPMNWTRARRRHSPGTIEHTLFQGFRRLAEVRAAHPALDGRSASRVPDVPSDALFFFERSFDGDRLLLVANFARLPFALLSDDLPDGWQGLALRDVLADAAFDADAEIRLGPYGVRWLAPEG